jgi:hypothetical protein
MNSTALAEALLRLVGNRNGARLFGQKAREKVERHFSERMMLEQTVQLYKAKIEKALPVGRYSFGRTSQRAV